MKGYVKQLISLCEKASQFSRRAVDYPVNYRWDYGPGRHAIDLAITCWQMRTIDDETLLQVLKVCRGAVRTTGQ